MKKIVLFLVLMIVPSMLLGDAYDEMAVEISRGATRLKNKKIAVLPFTYIGNEKSVGSMIVSERLTTKIVRAGEIPVVERSLLEKVLSEKRLGMTGIVDEEVSREVGKILGVGAIVTGTINDIESGEVEVNVRLVTTDKGVVLTAVSRNVKRTWGEGETARRKDDPTLYRQQRSEPIQRTAGVKTFIAANLGILAENSELKTGIIGGGQLGIIGDYLGASLSILHYSEENKAGMSEGATISKGSFQMTPVMFNGFFRIPIKNTTEKEMASLRFGGGIGYVSVSHEIAPEIVSFFRNFYLLELKEEVASGLGYQIGGGLDIFVTENISIGADLNYLFFKPELTATVDDLLFGGRVTTKTQLKLDTFIGLAAIKYHF